MAPRSAALVVLERMSSGMSATRRARLTPLHVGVIARGDDLASAAAAQVRALLGDDAGEQVRRALSGGLADHDARPAGYAGTRCAAPAPRGATLEAGGVTCCFIGEENLLADAWDENGSRAQRVAVHEFGHAVERLALTAAERMTLSGIHRVNLARRGARARDSAGAGEFFAESGEAWFGVHQLAPLAGGHGPEFFRSRLPSMAAFLERVYGPAR